MKTIKFKTIITACALLIMMLSSNTTFSKEHVTMSLKNITATANTIEYDLYIVNDGSTTLKLSACSYGVNFDKAILNGGTITYSCKENSRGVALSGLTSFSVATTKVGEVYQARMTSTPSQYDNAAELVSNIPFKVGRFKMTNSVPWTKNSKPDLALQEIGKVGLTVTQIVGYVGANTNLVALTPTLTTVTVVVEESPILNPSQTSTSTSSSSNHVAPILESNILSNETSVKIYPNPVHDELKLDFLAINKSSLTIKISDMQGRTIKQIQTEVVDGMNKISIDVSELTNALYSIQILGSNNFLHSQTFTKQ